MVFLDGKAVFSMKRRVKQTALIFLSLVLAAALIACSQPVSKDTGSAFFDSNEDGEQEGLADLLNDNEGVSPDQPDETPPPLPEPSPDTTAAPTPGPTEEPRSENWTVMIYLNGSDLESDNGEATLNLASMLSVDIPESINVLVYTGGTFVWQNDAISSYENQIHLVENGDLTLLESIEQKSMGESSTLAEFINFGQENYPADKKALIFWDHGGGSISGFGVDELFNFDGLLLSEMQQAFANSFDGQKFDLVGYDACLMATIEMASILAPYAEYMVASEENEPGGGWDYAYYWDALAKNPAMTGEELGIAITDGYYQKYKDSEAEPHTTCSVTDLSKIPALEDMLGTFAASLTTDIVTPESMNQLAHFRAHTESYGEMPGYVSPDMVDLYDFVDLQSDLNPALSDDLLRAIEDAVVYEVNGSQRIDSYGLSIYFPHNGKESFYDNLSIYSQLDFCPEYKQFAAAYASNLTNETYTSDIPEYESDVIEAPAPAEDDEDYSEIGSFYVQLTDEEMEYMSYVYCVLGWYLDNGDLIDLGYDSDLTIDYDTNTIRDNFGGWWTGLNGQTVAVYVMDETDDYVTYNIPVMYNGDKAVVTGSWIWDESYDEGGYYTYNGIYYTNDEYAAPSTKFSIDLQQGDAITPLYTTLFAEDGYDGYYEGDTFYVGDDGLYLELIWLPDGFYQYGFMFIDNYGGVHYSDFMDYELFE